jgi:hypothetical protein
MLIAPKQGESQEKQVKNITWHWCPNHAKWTRHKAQDCKGIFPKPKKAKEQTLARAMAALALENEPE